MAWVVLLLAGMGREGGVCAGNQGQARRGAIAAVVAAVGVLCLAAAIAADEWGAQTAGAWLGLAADVWIIFRGAAIVIAELGTLAGDIQGGRMTVVQLWRLATVQWMVAWIGAIAALRLRMKPEDMLGNERARQLLFVLPMLGVLPNVFMGNALRWWRAIAFGDEETWQVRARAWVVALVGGNVGRDSADDAFRMAADGGRGAVNCGDWDVLGRFSGRGLEVGGR
jgi:hypothetical protein